MLSDQHEKQLDACTAAGQSSCSGISNLYQTFKTAISEAETIATQNGVK